MNFWDHHGTLFLLSAVFFPRLTILFGTMLTPLFGILGWIGWLIAPRFVIAFYATVTYGDQNPFLVAVSWVVAISALGAAGGSARRAS